VVTALIIWAVSRIGQEERWASFVEYFRRMNLLVFAGILGVFSVAHIIIGLRWWLLLRTQSIFISFWAAVKLYLLGWFYNNFMPGSVGGDLVRAGYVTKHTEKRFEAALSVFVDRAIGVFSTLIIAVFFSLLFLRGQVNTIMSRYQRGFLRTFAEYRLIFLGVITVIVVVFCGFLVHRRSRALLPLRRLCEFAKTLNSTGQTEVLFDTHIPPKAEDNERNHNRQSRNRNQYACNSKSFEHLYETPYPYATHQP